MSEGRPLSGMSYLFAGPPRPDQAYARLEVVTCGGSTALSMPDVRVTVEDGGMKRATIEDAGITWSGTGPSVTAAVIALLADRAGFEATVTFKPERDDQ